MSEIKKISNEFTAVVPDDFYEKILEWYVEEEGRSRNEVEESYGDSFNTLSNDIAGNVSSFTLDLGYADKALEGVYCFEVNDNDVCIPVEILEDIREVDERYL